jgi:hypothetical protein
MGYLSRRKALHVQTRGYYYWWEDDPIRQLVLHEKNFGWMAVTARHIYLGVLKQRMEG